MKQPFDTRHHDLSGCANIDLFDKDDFNALAQRIAKYNPDRFDPVALRIFIQKSKPVITLYALDTYKQETSSQPKDKLPVRKFKLRLSWDEFIGMVKRMDCTVTHGDYDINDILVINK
jgi:hypothetical protein